MHKFSSYEQAILHFLKMVSDVTVAILPVEVKIGNIAHDNSVADVTAASSGS